MEKFHFSTGANPRIPKVACSIADLAGTQDKAAPHGAEAIQYRGLDRGAV